MKSIHRNQIHSNGQQPKRPFGFFKKERKKTDKDVSGAVLDLTSGSVPKQLIRFTIPLLLSNLLQGFYSMVDMAVVGQFVGSAGLAAVSNAAQLSFVINAVGMGITMGGTVLVARCKGAGDVPGQKRAVETLFAMTMAAALVMTVLSLLFYRQAFSLLGVPQPAMQDADAYMEILCAGTVFVFGYNMVVAVQRGLGDAKRPLYFVLLASVLNIVLDLLLVGGLHLGTPGAAAATIASQAVSFLAAAGYLRRQEGDLFNFRVKRIRIGRQEALTILRVGLPSAAQTAVVNLSYLLVTGMLNQFDVTVAAAAGAGLKINTFAGMFSWAVGSAVTTMVSQNLGAKKTERAEKACKSGLLLAMGATALVALLVNLTARPLLGIFDSDPAVIEEGVRYLRICCSFNALFYGAMYVFDSFATGAGSAGLAFANACLDAVGMRLLLCWLLGFWLSLGVEGIYWGQALSSVLPAVMGGIYFLCGRWKQKAL